MILNPYQTALLGMCNAIINSYNVEARQSFGHVAYAQDNQTLDIKGVRGLGNTEFAKALGKLTGVRTLVLVHPDTFLEGATDGFTTVLPYAPSTCDPATWDYDIVVLDVPGKRWETVRDKLAREFGNRFYAHLLVVIR